jgi:hypothetical protein
VTDQLSLDPTRTALLVTDYQVGLLHRLPDVPALLDRVDVLNDASADPDTHIFPTCTIFPRHATVIDLDALLP